MKRSKRIRGGDISSKDVGDFQANVGQVSANIGVITGTIFGSLSIIAAIVFTIMAFVPMTDASSNDLCLPQMCSNPIEGCVNGSCVITDPRYQDKGFINSNVPCGQVKPCPNSESCVNGICQITGDNPKRRHYSLLIVAAIFLAIGIGLIWGSRAWRNYTKTSRTASQIGGTMAEVGMLENIFGRRN